MVAQIAAGDDAECADGGQGAGFGAAQGVDAVAISDAVALWATGQVDVTCECVARMFLFLTLPLAPSGIVSSTASVLVATLTVAPAAATSQRSGVVIVTVTRASLAVRVVLVPVSLVGTCAAWSVRRLAVAAG